MTKLKINIGRRVILFKISKKRGRPKKTFFYQTKNFISYLKRIYQDNRFRGNKFSRVLRRIFEIKKIKKVLGLNLIFGVFLTGIFRQSHSLINSPTSSFPVYALDEPKITTQASISSPLRSPYQTSQGYHTFHQAIDLRAPLGSFIHPIMEGKVEKVSFSSFGYGNYLVITHSPSLKSLYAHLGKVFVRQEQEVSQETILGTVGTSGWSTGPHLHLEVWQNGKPINPQTLLEKKSRIKNK